MSFAAIRLDASLGIPSIAEKEGLVSLLSNKDARDFVIESGSVASAAMPLSIKKFS